MFRFGAVLVVFAPVTVSQDVLLSQESLDATVTDCTDVAPDNQYTCAEQAGWGKCGESWMYGYCCTSCGCGTDRGCPGGGGGGGGSIADVLQMGCGDCHSCGIEGYDSTRQTMAELFANACQAHGCTTQEHAVVLAMAMQESDKMDQTDTSKGSSGPSSNWSPFNMNMDQLSRIGCDSSCAESLGQYSYDYDIDTAVYYVLVGLRGGTAIGGTCDFLNFHRGGYTGWTECQGQSCSCDCTYDCKAYKDATADSSNTILEDTSYFTNGERVCQSVPHVR